MILLPVTLAPVGFSHAPTKLVVLDETSIADFAVQQERLVGLGTTAAVVV